MLGIILLFFIGKYFYKLAEKYDKNRFGYGALGIITYYAGTIIFALLFGIIGEVIKPGYLDTMNEYALGLISITFGLAASYILYMYFKKEWKKSVVDDSEMINQIGKKE